MLAGVVVTVLLGAALVLTAAAMRRLSTALLMTAGAAVIAALVVAVVAHVEAPAPIGVPLALVGIAAAVVGGDPITRRVLAIAASGRVRETPDGGIVVTDDAGPAASDDVVLLRDPRKHRGELHIRPVYLRTRPVLASSCAAKS